MLRQSINGEDVIITYNKVKKKYLVIYTSLYNSFMYYCDKKPITDQDVEVMERQLEQIRLETEYLKLRYS